MIYKHSAGGVVITNGQVLALSWTDRNFICLPKGGLEEGESSEDAAIREVNEETGYRVDIIASLGSWRYEFFEKGMRNHKTVDYYLMSPVDNRTPTPSRSENEHFSNCWLDIDRAYDRFTFDDAKEAFAMAVTILQIMQ